MMTGKMNMRILLIILAMIFILPDAFAVPENEFEYLYYPKPTGEDNVGDPMPITVDGTHYIYYLYDNHTRVLSGGAHPICSYVSTDMVHFSEGVTVLQPGYSFQRDHCVGTGSVCEKDGVFYFYYSGHNEFLPYKAPIETIFRAVSHDGMRTWSKDADYIFTAPEGCGYDEDNWRDPFVFYNDEAGEYWMLIASRLDKTSSTKDGVIVLYSSDDILTWTHRGILYAPGNCYVAECPQMLKIGDTWYLTYNEFLLTHFGGIHSDAPGPFHYTCAVSSSGPFISPRTDTLDGRGLCAGRICGNSDTGYYLVGWLPQRETYSNHGTFSVGNWGWGGNAVIHKITQNTDRTLTASAPEKLFEEFTKTVPNTPDIIKGTAENSGNTWMPGQNSIIRFGTCPDRFKLETTLTWKEDTKDAGLIFHLTDSMKNLLYIRFDGNTNRLRFDMVDSFNLRYVSPLCFRPLELIPGKSYSITVIAEGSVLCVYVDDSLVMTTRMYELDGNGFGLFGGLGTTTFTEPVLSALP